MTRTKRARLTVEALPEHLRQCPNCLVWFYPHDQRRRYCDASCQHSARQKAAR